MRVGVVNTQERAIMLIRIICVKITDGRRAIFSHGCNTCVPSRLMAEYTRLAAKMMESAADFMLGHIYRIRTKEF